MSRNTILEGLNIKEMKHPGKKMFEWWNFWVEMSKKGSKGIY